MKTPRIALGFLIGWTVGIVALVITGALAAPQVGASEPSAWTEQDYKMLAVVLGGFITWFVGLATIALVTIVVRLGHLTEDLTPDGRVDGVGRRDASSARAREARHRRPTSRGRSSVTPD